MLPKIAAMFFLLFAQDDALFHDVSDTAGIAATHRAIWDEDAPVPYDDAYLAAGSAWEDYDNDGWVDLYVTGNLDPKLALPQPGRRQLRPDRAQRNAQPAG